MGKHWSINTIFWVDGTKNEDRKRNANFSIPKNLELVDFLKQNDCNVTYNIFDFSLKKTLDNAAHIPFQTCEYKRSEKINIVLKNDNSDFFSIIDADCFFDEADYPKILELYNSLDSNNTYTFDWKKVNSAEHFDFNNRLFKRKDDWSYAMGHGLNGGLGAFFVVSTLKLKEIGGFDETIKTWGEEDGVALEKILKISTRIRNYDLSPYHIPHFTDWSNPLYFNNNKKR